MDPKDSNRDGSRRKPTGGVEGRAMENGVAAAGQRGSEAESFVEFAKRVEIGRLREMVEREVLAV